MATNAINPKNFADAKQSVIIRPRTANQMAFLYHDFSDLKNLVKFVGSKPSIDEEGNLWFGKTMIPDNCLVIRNSYGKVTEVLSYEQAATHYEIVADSEFKPEHANVVEKKASEPKAAGADKGMTRTELKEALTAKKIDFKSGLTKEQLQAIYDSKVSKK
jgi:hypothetical protein